MLIPQFCDRQPFVDVLRKEFGEAERLDIATAWARASGVGLLWKPLTAFLERGGTLRAVVGLDRENTSIEGLQMLLDLKGATELWVRHNEAATIYHPKLYGFRTPTECRVYVGSNNLTGAGLSANEEISAFLAEPKGGKLEASLLEYFAALTDEHEGLALRLDPDLLHKLIDAGYVLPEVKLRGKSARSGGHIPKGKALFAFKSPKRRRPPPEAPTGRIEPQAAEPHGDWRRVFVKLRLARGTQGQVPVGVARELRRRLGEADEDGPIPIILKNTGDERVISPTYAKRSPDHANTYKIEALAPQEHAVLQIEFIGERVVVEQFDTATPAGKAILDFVMDGLETAPRLTMGRGLPDGNSEEVREAAAELTLYRYD